MVASILGLTLVLLQLGVGTPTRVVSAQAAGGVIYQDALAAGWENWSWDTEANFANTTPARGSQSIQVRHTAANGGFSLRIASPVNAQGLQALTFWAYGGSGGNDIQVYTESSDTGGRSQDVQINIAAGVWRQYSVSMQQLGNPPAIALLNFQETRGVANQPAYVLDDITLVGAPAGQESITINTSVAAQAFRPRMMLGSNLPMWWGKETFENPTFRARIRAMGSGILRLPGGSDSNKYGWLSCEKGADVAGAAPCGPAGEDWLSYVARPTDFINLLRATGRQGLWIVNLNATKKEAAALVAFMNGSVHDTRVIGVDIKGMDWKTVGHWAQLRAANGNPEPIGIKYWDFGNEVYGGIGGLGTDCESWGWEITWTCNGGEYINGIGQGAARREGFLETRAAMRAVDSTIRVGGSGHYEVGEYSNWTGEVVAAGGTALDYYVVHPYFYYEHNAIPVTDPTRFAQILARPQAHIPDVRQKLNSIFAANGNGRQIPISANEINLFGVYEADTESLMRTQLNALYMADSTGQLIQQGFDSAMQWNVMNGDGGPSGNYGLVINDASFTRTPQYWSYVLWSRFGSATLPVNSTHDAASALSVYAGRVNSNTVSVLVINKKRTAVTSALKFNGAARIVSGQADVSASGLITSTSPLFNGKANPAANLSDAPSAALPGASGNSTTYTFAPNSVTLLRFKLGGVTLAKTADPGTDEPEELDAPEMPETPGGFSTFLPVVGQ
jgi:hypothetical protein